MPIWIRKSFVVLVSILTFGLVTPSLDLLNSNVQAGSVTQLDAIEPVQPLKNPTENDRIDEYKTEREVFLEEIIKIAEDQAYVKFGSKIRPVIEDEFREIVLPNIEKVIEQVTNQYPEEDLVNLVITESKGKGDSEKIFHIKNTITKEDVIRFHVRKDHPPLEGYWFNFHYHTYHDHFETHHALGRIFWSKNTPPKWMS